MKYLYVIFFGGLALFLIGETVLFYQSYAYAKIQESIAINNDIPIKSTYSASSFQRALPSHEDRDVKLLFVGDIMLGRYVESLINRYGESYPYELLGSVLTDYDAVIANLEGPVVKNHFQTPNDSLSFSFHEKRIQELARQGVSMVSLSNNHSDNRGESGYAETEHYLDSYGIAHYGHPRAIDDRSVYATEINGQHLIFVGFNATYSTFDKKKAIELIKSTREKNTDSIIIVSMHWGTEYQTKSNRYQQEIGHAIIDSGANIVIGHHPHVSQEIEEYHRGIIAYSLGNFIFDQYFSKETQKGIALALTISNGSVLYTPYDVVSVQSQPKIVIK